MSLDLTTYIYARSIFGSIEPHMGRLMHEIESSALQATKRLQLVYFNEIADQIEITFEQALDSSELLFLDGLIAAHVGEPSVTPKGATWTLSDIKPTGSNGGTCLAMQWQTRELNDIKSSFDSTDCTLSSNQFTLAPGKYKLDVKSPAYFVYSHVTRVYNVTTAEVVATGSSEQNIQVNQSQGYTATQSFSTVSCVVEVATGETDTFEIQQYCSNEQLSSGLGRANGVAGTPEVYTSVWVQKTAS